jgi:hypothetical protein
MLRIRRPEDQDLAIFAISGRIEERNVPELEQLIDGEWKVGDITFDLEEVRLVDREAVRFLAACEIRGIKLKNCPSYIRQWIRTGSGTGYEPLC